MPPPRGLVQWLDQQLHKSGLLPRGGRMLIAVSGGADSVALLRLLAAVNRSDYWDWTLIVGHIDHGMRGRASTSDAAFVKSLAKQLHLKYLVTRLKLGAKASEADARDARLRALGTILKRERCTAVIMAHHADDQAETILMRLFRGCGLEGLMGMGDASAIDGLRIVRPLLELRREALCAYLQEIGQPWREDHTNALPLYTRNRLRAEVLPLVEKLWPRAVEAVGRLSRVAAEAREPVAYAAHAVWRAEAVVTSKRVTIPRTALRTWPAIMAEVLRHAIETVGGTREIADWERIQEAVRIIQGTDGGKQVQMGLGVIIRVGRDVIIERQVTRANPASPVRNRGGVHERTPTAAS